MEQKHIDITSQVLHKILVKKPVIKPHKHFHAIVVAMDFTKGLNDQQKEVVLATEGPIMVLAGAGAGKTRVITHRIAHLMSKGVAPESILAVTFTNKAAKEMRERVEGVLREHEQTGTRQDNTLPLVSTFHALGVFLLRQHAQSLGLTKFFSIYDRTDSLSAIKTALTEAGYDPKQMEPRKVLGTISRQKGQGLTWNDYQEQAGTNYYTGVVSAVWERYDRILAHDKALDFDDLLLKTVLLLKNNPDIQKYYNQRWQYVHIDEYQDTSAVQYELMTLLVGPHHNVCVVGDIDQNIYSWRGADIENIFAFEEQFPGARTILLEQNYRSTKTIITVSNDVIAKNTRRKEKNLFTENEDGDAMTLYSAYDERDEARWIAERSEELVESGVAPEQIAVLYRANFQSRNIEDAFLYKNIPYRVLGTKYFDRKEVKDVIAYLRAAYNPENVADIKRIINVPVRGIGKVTLLKLFEGKREELPNAAKKRVEDFYQLLEKIRGFASAHPLPEAISFIIKETGLEEQYKKGGTEDDVARLENMYELVTLASRYGTTADEEHIMRFLDDVALTSDQDSMDETVSAVTLMTVHASKGLEFDYVFITGLEEGLFPHERFDEEADNEEERRLFYVALTRARKKIFLSYTNARMIYGNRQINIPSNFIGDIDEAFISVEEEGALGKTVYLE